MWINVLLGVLIPLAGTTLGSACVFFLKDKILQIVRESSLNIIFVSRWQIYGLAIVNIWFIHRKPMV